MALRSTLASRICPGRPGPALFPAQRGMLNTGLESLAPVPSGLSASVRTIECPTAQARPSAVVERRLRSQPEEDRAGNPIESELTS